LTLCGGVKLDWDSTRVKRTRSAPSPRWGEGWGEGDQSLQFVTPSPCPSPRKGRGDDGAAPTVWPESAQDGPRVKRMHMHDNDSSFVRRSFLGPGAMPMRGRAGDAQAQQATTPGAEAKKPPRLLAEYIVGFDLGKVPQAAIDRSRIALIDTIGVMLAGSH